MATKSRGKTVNLALVGCGGMAGLHLRAYEALWRAGERRFRFVAAVDEVEERAREFATRIEQNFGFTVSTYKNVGQLLDGEKKLHGADICSPHGLHHILACRLLAGGIHILCEKPIGITVRATKKIIAAARRHQRIAATAEQCRRSIGQRAIHWAFNQGGLLGEPRLFFAISSAWEDPVQVPGWHWQMDRRLGGVAW